MDPYEFLIWWHCGYPASDATCAKGWTSLKERVGVTPEQLLRAKPTSLNTALRACGLIPELSAKRVKLIATAVTREFSGNLAQERFEVNGHFPVKVQRVHFSARL